MQNNPLFKHFRYDITASIIVFFVAVSLFFRTAFASGTRLFSGFIARITDGIIVGTISESPSSLSGHLALLTLNVLLYITTLGGNWNAFLLAMVIVSSIQLLIRFMKAGFVPIFFSKSVMKGWEHFIPFVVTIVSILFTDLLNGITVGILLGIFYTLRGSFRNSHYIKSIQFNENEIAEHHLLAEEISFLNKARLLKKLACIVGNSRVIIDCANSTPIYFDVIELMKNCESNTPSKNIVVEKINTIKQ